jgi:hypothetical protein
MAGWTSGALTTGAGVGWTGSALAVIGFDSLVVLWEVGRRPVMAATPTAENTVTEMAAAVSRG